MPTLTSINNQLSLRNFAMLTISGLINAFGVTVFLSPVSLYDGGISGTSMLLAQITPDYMTLSLFLLLLNIPLFLFGLKRQGIASKIFLTSSAFRSGKRTMFLCTKSIIP